MCRGLELLAKYSFILDVLLPSYQSRLSWCHQLATALLTEITVYYNSKKYLIVHKQLLILHWNAYRSLVVSITTLWFVAKQPNLTKNVEQYMYFHVIYGC